MMLTEKTSSSFSLRESVESFEITGVLHDLNDQPSPNQIVAILDKKQLKITSYSMTDQTGNFRLIASSVTSVVVIAFDKAGNYMPAVVDEVEPSIKVYMPSS